MNPALDSKINDETVMEILGVPCTNLPPHVKMEYQRLYDTHTSPVKTVTALGLLAAYGDHTHPAYEAAANFLRGKAVAQAGTCDALQKQATDRVTELRDEVRTLQGRADLLDSVLRRAAVVTGLKSEFDTQGNRLADSVILETLFNNYTTMKGA